MLFATLVVAGCNETGTPHASRPADDVDAAFASSVERELTSVRDTGPLAIALDDASVDQLIHLRRMIQQRRAIAVENLANAQTIGFKRSHLVQASETDARAMRDFEQGSFKTTDRPFDLAINGQGFLQVQRTNGSIAFTRNGNLFVNDRREIVISERNGPRLMPTMTVPARTTDVSISQDGEVDVMIAGNAQPTRIGQLQLARFRDAESLQPVGGAMFAATPESGEPICGAPGVDSSGSIQQNVLEQSNVDATRERLTLVRADEQLALIDRLIAKYETPMAPSAPTRQTIGPVK